MFRVPALNNNRMSSKKIIRLRTPTKPKESPKIPESTFAHTRFHALDSVTELQQQESAEGTHLALINEVNKLYREIEALKRKVADEERINDELCSEKKRLRTQIQALERECASQREMYELERHNHQRLREFYELREQEWQQIVLHHRQMLQEYDRRNNTSLSDIAPEELALPLHSDPKIEHKQPSHIESEKQPPGGVEQALRPILQGRLGEEGMEGPQAYYITQISRLYTQEKQFARRSELRLCSSESQTKGLTHKNPEADELFDRVMRKTYCWLRQQGRSIEQVKHSEDMLKLRQAKTSTRERLLKTVRKLEFQAGSEEELLAFCEYVGQAVLSREKMLRGDLVSEFLVDRLQECEKLALGSNSEVERAEASLVWEGGSRENLELLLNSAIKQPQGQSAVSQNIRYSISSLQNLSELIGASGQQQ